MEPAEKAALSERDICTKFITPAIAAAGWNTHSQMREEVNLTAGRVVVRGNRAARDKSTSRAAHAECRSYSIGAHASSTSARL